MFTPWRAVPKYGDNKDWKQPVQSHQKQKREVMDVVTFGKSYASSSAKLS